MKIGMILDKAFPPDERVEKEALSLMSNGHQVVLFCLDRLKPAGFDVVKGIQVSRYQSNWLEYKMSALVYTIPVYKWLIMNKLHHFIRSNDLDVIHIHDMVIADAVISVNSKLDKPLPVVLDLHENRPEIMRAYKHVNTLPGRYLINLDVWKNRYYNLAGLADRVVVVTELAKEDIIRYSNKKSDEVVVVPNTVNLKEFTSYPIDTELVDRMKKFYNLLYIGDTSIRRGTDVAIKAVKLLIDKIPNLRLWMVGKSSADEELKKLCKKYEVSDYVLFQGWKNYSLLPSYITGSQITLSPLKRNKHHDTTFANKLFMYMALGKPVIVSDCIAQADLVTKEKCGLIFSSENAEDLAEKVFLLYTNPELSEKLGTNGYLAVKNKWNWDLTVNELINMYNNM